MVEHSLNAKAKETQSQEYGKRDIEKEFDKCVCEVEGEIPDWIDGIIYKQAGGAFGEKHNQLDGLAHLSSFKIQNGKVLFSNKFMRTLDYANFINTGERKWNGVSTGTNTSFSSLIRQKIQSFFSRSIVSKSEIKYNSFNPNVTTWCLDNGRIVAAQTETGGIVCQVDPENLDTIGEVNTMNPGTKGGQVIQTPAHFFREGENGGYHVAVELKVNYLTIIPTFTFFYNIYYGDKAPFKLVHQEEVSKFKWTEREKVNQILEKRPSYMHGVATSENYFVRIETSCKYDFVKLLSFDMKDGFFAMTPYVETPIVFTVFKKMKKANGEGILELVTKIVSDQSFMLWHVANCFETENGNLIIESTCSKELYDEPNFFARFTLDLEAGSATYTHLLAAHEFPIINPSKLMEEHKHVYLLKGDFGDMSLTKYKLSRGVDSHQDLEYEIFKEKHYILSEPCFVASPEGSEDEGILLLMVADQEKEESFLAFIDAQSGKVAGRAIAPGPVNIGLHAVYVPNEGLATYRSKM